MIFSCTKKVLDKIKKYKIIEPDKVEINFYNWYVDAIVLERKTYFLFTNSITLFSFFVYGGTKKELQNIEQIFATKLTEQIEKEIGTENQYVKNVFQKNQMYKFTKTNSRSVLGSMNDIKENIKVQLWHKGKLKYTYDLINSLLNNFPVGALKYATPNQKMKEMLELTSKQILI